MNWGPWLFIFYTIVFFTKAISAGYGAWWCWSNRKLNGNSEVIGRLALVFAAIAYNNMSQLVANACGFRVRPVYTIGYAIAYWQGEVASAVAIILLVMFLMRGRVDQK